MSICAFTLRSTRRPRSVSLTKRTCAVTGDANQASCLNSDGSPSAVCFLNCATTTTKYYVKKICVRVIFFYFYVETGCKPFFEDFFVFKWRTCAEKLTELVTRTPRAEWTVICGREKAKRTGSSWTFSKWTLPTDRTRTRTAEPQNHRMTSGPVSCVSLLAFVCHSVHVCNCDTTSAVLLLCAAVSALHCLHVCSLVAVIRF